MFNKCLTLVGLAMAVGVAANLIPNTLRGRASVVNNNLYIGRRQPGDWQLSAEYVYRAAIPSRVVNQTLNINGGYNLTFIAAIDQAWNSTAGATARLISGGPGTRNATLFFTSKVGQPIYFRVNAFGRR